MGKLLRRVHPRLGIILALFLLISASTGFLRANSSWYWPPRYKEKKKPEASHHLETPQISLEQMFKTITREVADGFQIDRIELKRDFGRLLYQVEGRGRTKAKMLIDASTGELLSPLRQDLAAEAAYQYVTSKPTIKSITRLEDYKAHKQREERPAYKVSFDDRYNTEIFLDADTGEILDDLDDRRRRGLFIVRLHEMDFWYLRRPTLSFIGIGLIFLSFSGLSLWASDKKAKTTITKGEPMQIKEKVRERWNKESPSFELRIGHGIHSQKEKEAWQEKLRQALGERNSLVVLDVGTGTGAIARLLAEMGHRVTGIDFAERMLEKASAKAAQAHLQVEFRLGDAENVPFADATFDAVTCRHLLWQLPDPADVIKEWLRVLKPRGKLVVIEGKWKEVSLGGKTHELAANLLLFLFERRIRRELNSKDLPYYGKLNPTEAAQFLRETGLTEVEVDELKSVREAQIESVSWYQRIAYSFPRYMVWGTKPESALHLPKPEEAVCQPNIRL